MSTTGSTFLAVEDDVSIGSFDSISIRVSFNETLEVRNFEKDEIRNFYDNELSTSIQMLTDTIDEVAVTQESHYLLPADALGNNNSI